jgi:outer membrane protein OmpA-like peptidoglycan-associated protein
VSGDRGIVIGHTDAQHGVARGLPHSLAKTPPRLAKHTCEPMEVNCSTAVPPPSVHPAVMRHRQTGASINERIVIMCRAYRSPFRVAILASSAALLFGGAALAQSVPVFDDAPSIEQLRNIMIPQSQPGAGRTIVIQRPDSGASPVQHAATQVLSAPKPAASPASPADEPVNQVAAAEPVQQPAPKAAPASEAAAVAFHINFAFNSAELPASADAMVDKMAMLMKESPEMKIRVEGHTDAIGSAGYNMSLSQRRALSVAEYLVQKGVEASRLIPVGKGMTEPLTQNRYDPANRRVQFVRVG